MLQDIFQKTLRPSFVHEGYFPPAVKSQIKKHRRTRIIFLKKIEDKTIEVNMFLDFYY